jgi:hypothetical protein
MPQERCNQLLVVLVEAKPSSLLKKPDPLDFPAGSAAGFIWLRQS